MERFYENPLENLIAHFMLKNIANLPTILEFLGVFSGERAIFSKVKERKIKNGCGRPPFSFFFLLFFQDFFRV